MQKEDKMSEKEKRIKRDVLVPVRLSDYENKIIAEKAKKSGLDKSVYLRMSGMKNES